MPLKHTVEEIKLKNGARGLLIDTPGTTTVCYNFCFRAGTSFVARPERSQTAHIMEHLAFGANAKFDSNEAFSQEFTKNGAYHNAYTSSNDMSYDAAAPLMEWERILDLQTLAITQPRYTQKNLDAEKSNVHEELEGYATNHRRILWQEIMQASGLSRWYDPQEIKTIAPVTLKDVQDHFAHTHVTNNLQFIVAGHLKTQQQKIVAQLESWPLAAGKRLPLTQETIAPGSHMVFIRRKDLPTLTFNLYFFIPRELSRDELRAMGVLCHVLTDTFHSRIFGKARSRGLCYGMGSDFVSNATGVSSFMLGGQVSFSHAAELFQLIIDELKEVQKNGITEEELQQAKDYRLGSLQMSNETVGSLVNWYMGEYYEAGRIDYLDSMPARIAKTKQSDAQALLNEFITSGAWTFGGVGNSTKKEFEPYYAMMRDAFSKKSHSKEARA